MSGPSNRRTFSFPSKGGFKRILIPLGIFLLLYAILSRPILNYLYDHNMLGAYAEWIDALNRYFKVTHAEGPHPLDEYHRRTDVYVLQLAVFVLLVRGLWFTFQKKERVFLLVLNIVLAFVVLSVAEIYFNLESSQKRYGSVQYEKQSEEINRSHEAQENSLGFTDRERTKEKPEGVFRIACLGDSFVWGDGLPLEDVWSHILERKLTEAYGNRVEVLHWGRRGWSTQDELEFLKGAGKEFDIDLLIIGFVVNDPHIRGVSMPRRFFIWDKIARKFPLFKNTLRFVTMRVNDLLTATPVFERWEYFGWDHALYRNANLKAYEGVVVELDRFLKERGIPYFFVTLPLPTHGLFWEYDKIFKIFDRHAIEYLDTMPLAMDKFGDYTAREIREKLWANPVNGHPGRPLTELYAETVFDYVTQKWFDRIAPMEEEQGIISERGSNAA